MRVWRAELEIRNRPHRYFADGFGEAVGRDDSSKIAKNTENEGFNEML
jgi:hypothetical protein